MGVPLDGLAAWYTMDHINGSTLIDMLDNLNGTIHGSKQQFEGVDGLSLGFQGGEFVDTPRWPFTSSGFSVSLWVRLTSLSASDGAWIVSSRSGASTESEQEWQIIVYPSSAAGFLFQLRQNGAFITVSSGETISLNTWYHVCCVFGNGKLKLYVNGVLVGEVTVTQSVNTGATYTRFGRRGWETTTSSSMPGDLDGMLDQVRPYTKALSDAEVIELANEQPRSISGAIDENLAANEWLVIGSDVETGESLSTVVANTSNFTLPFTSFATAPVFVTIAPQIGNVWAADQAVSFGQKCFPPDPIATPYYYEALNAGTTSSSEPIWPTGAGGQVVDNDITWQLVERLIQPITHGPLIPS